jgi:glutaredoxin-like protein
MSQAPVTVYSRPGCPYCYLLRRGLRRRGVTFTEIDIWQRPEAAAAVRAVADGNETVPTVHVAGQWLVNPRAAHVQRLAVTGT